MYWVIKDDDNFKVIESDVQPNCTISNGRQFAMAESVDEAIEKFHEVYTLEIHRVKPWYKRMFSYPSLAKTKKLVNE